MFFADVIIIYNIDLLCDVFAKMKKTLKKNDVVRLI